ncbi:acyltransferase family protein [Porticoccus sp. GXU_MW_L64]
MIEDKKKFKAIHGMRGLAAISVVIFHLSGNIQPQFQGHFFDFALKIFSYGYLGVPIFFVISGFVISYSTASAQVNFRYFGNFVLRRSIRLDITYWASIMLALVLLAIKNKFLDQSEVFPSVGTILLNMFYLQELMEADPVISVVYWTLCLEVQFYLFYILSIWGAQKISIFHSYGVNVISCCSLGFYSILLDLGFCENNINGLFVSNWHYFLMGVLACNVVRGLPFSHHVFISWLVIEVLFQGFFKFKEYAVAGVLCSVLIFLMWKYELMDKLFNGRKLMYLGTVSYPLYLVHPDIGWKVISFAKYLMNDSVSSWQAGIILIIGVYISIIVAHIFHLLFEVPTQRIAKELKSKNFFYILQGVFKVRVSKTDREY